ncbi:MAG: hypothetical protein K1X75_17975 [Leptospirales bacterium]|nr:hypothetical protein [Leptospirales bacterium]
MRICSHCEHQNPDEGRYCLKCGQFLGDAAMRPAANASLLTRTYALVKRLPAPLIALLALASVALAIAVPILFVVAAGTIEGFMSAILLAAGVVAFRVARVRSASLSGAALAFYALMGMALDQPGNWIYNKPFELLFCPEGSSLNRSIQVGHPLPERTDIQQQFVCYRGEEAVDQISMIEFLGVRLAEYFLLGMLLLTGHQIYDRLRQQPVAG